MGLPMFTEAFLARWRQHSLAGPLLLTCDEDGETPSGPYACTGDDIWQQGAARCARHSRQQQSAWDNVRTVALHEEEQMHHVQQWEASTQSLRVRWWWAIQGSLLAAAVGLLSFATYVVIEMGIRALSSVRFGFCTDWPLNPENHCSADAWVSWGDGFLGFCANVGFGTSMAAASAWLVARFAPAASGSGIPEIKTILNGLVVSDVLSFRTLAVKVPGLILAVASGMALGHEGPMVHVGVCWAQFLIRFFPQFQNEGKRRELYSAGVAAGVSSAFGTPVGGVLFSRDEVSSYFPPQTLLRAFLASVVATVALSVANLQGTKHLTLFDLRNTVTFHPSEFLMFALLGLAGGLVGALFNAINIRWNAFRMSPEYRKHVSSPVHEVVLISLLTLVTSWPLALTRPLNTNAIYALFDTCTEEASETVHSRLQLVVGLCTTDGRFIWNGYVLAELGAAAAIRFLQTALTIGTVCPAGLFVPSLFIGAALGRCLGLAVKSINTGHWLFSHNLDPGVYSMVGAAAVMCGVCRMTVSLVVIMLELTGGLNYVVPFMLAIFIARVVGGAINESIYDQYLVLKGYPFLHEELGRALMERCGDVMETRLATLDVGPQPSVADLRTLLRQHGFRGFPIVDGSRFIGYIQRTRLESLVDQVGANRGELAAVDLGDLMPCADTTTMRMAPGAPLSQAHQVFKQLRCKHIFVIGEEALLGILSKKSFLQYLREGKAGYVRGQTPDDMALELARVPVAGGGDKLDLHFRGARCAGSPGGASHRDAAASAAGPVRDSDAADGEEGRLGNEAGSPRC